MRYLFLKASLGLASCLGIPVCQLDVLMREGGVTFRYYRGIQARGPVNRAERTSSIIRGFFFSLVCTPLPFLFLISLSLLSSSFSLSRQGCPPRHPVLRSQAIPSSCCPSLSVTGDQRYHHFACSSPRFAVSTVRLRFPSLLYLSFGPPQTMESLRSEVNGER